MAGRSDYYQVHFLPWFNVERTIRIGPVTLWPYFSNRNEIVKDSSIREQFDEIFKCYVDHVGNPVDSVTVCSYGDYNFRPLSNEERRAIRSAIDILIFISIAPQVKNAVCANDKSSGPPSADVFELVSQNFIPGHEIISVRAGSHLSIGWKLGEISFPEPWAKGGSLVGSDDALLGALGDLLKKATQNKETAFAGRVFRSLEWFRMAHIEGGGYKTSTKVVLMATAFETLLGTPKNRLKKHALAKYINKNVSHEGMTSSSRKDQKGNAFTATLAEWWIWDFYDMRNAIVHGDEFQIADLRYIEWLREHTNSSDINDEKDWLTHLIVADLMFWECMIHELYKECYFAKEIDRFATAWRSLFKPKSKPCDEADIDDSLKMKMLRHKFDICRVHKALGWENC